MVRGMIASVALPAAPVAWRRACVRCGTDMGTMAPGGKVILSLHDLFAVLSGAGPAGTALVTGRPGIARRGSLRPFLVDGAACGGLVGSVEDRARFLQLHLRDGELDGPGS